MKIKFLAIVLCLIMINSGQSTRLLSRNEVIHVVVRHSLAQKAEHSLINLVMKFNIEYPQFQVILDRRSTDAESLNKTVNEVPQDRPHLILLSQTQGKILKNLTFLYNPISKIIPEKVKNLIPILRFPFSDPEQLETFTLPFAYTSTLLFINKKLFRQAGLTDTPPATWEELEIALPSLKKVGFQPLLSRSTQQIFFDHFAEVNQGALLMPETSEIKGKNHYMERIQHIQQKRLERWTTEKFYKEVKTLQELNKNAVKGKSAIFFQNAEYYETLTNINPDEIPSNYAVAPYPHSIVFYKKAFALNPIGSSLWVLQGHPEDEEAVKTFLNYLMRIEIQAYWHEQTTFLPMTYEAFTFLKEQNFYKTHPVHYFSCEQVINR